VRYVGERNSGFEGSASLPNYRLPDYTLVDLRAGGRAGPVQVTLFVRNLLDKRAQLGRRDELLPRSGAT
jgi:outer membrane receptor protein involved in Fe transport